jgi:hypothetical protein
MKTDLIQLLAALLAALWILAFLLLAVSYAFVGWIALKERFERVKRFWAEAKRKHSRP